MRTDIWSYPIELSTRLLINVPSLAYLLSTELLIRQDRYLNDSFTYTRFITTAQGLRGHHVAILPTIAYVVP